MNPLPRMTTGPGILMRDIRACFRALALLAAVPACASSQAAASDDTFDFVLGEWRIAYEWLLPDGSYLELDGTMHAKKILNGRGIIEEWVLDPGGELETAGITIRNFDVASASWSVNWYDLTNGTWGSPAEVRWTGNRIRFDGPISDRDGLFRRVVTFSNVTTDGFDWRQDRHYPSGRVVEGQIRQTYQRVKPADPVPGDLIVFVSNRDGNREVYGMSADGGEQVNLTRHAGRDQAPALAPDHSRIAWLSDRSGRIGVWVMASDGSEPRLVREVPEADFGLAWSPDGETLAVTLQAGRGGQHDLALVDITTGRLTHLTETPETEEVTPSWGPRGAFIYYVAGSGAATSLMRLDVQVGTHEVIRAGLPSVSFPVVSPSGGEVLLRSRTDQFDVLLLTLEDGEVTNVSRHPADDWGATWSHDGTRILFASDRDGDMEIYALDVVGGGLTQLTNNDARDWMPSGG